MTAELDWGFARRPGWLASHLFALVMIVSMVFLGLWQLDRLDQRQMANELIAARSVAEPVGVSSVLGLSEPELDYLAVSDQGRYLDPEVVRVANQSQDARAGEWVIALFETTGGDRVLVNRGFVLREQEAAPAIDGSIEGWMRGTQVKDGTFGATVSDEGERVPRLDVAAIAGRIDGGVDITEGWVQLSTVPDQAAIDAAGAVGEVIPAPIPLPPIDEGSHLSYAIQWFTFAAMGGVVYGLILRRRAAGGGQAA